MKKYFKQFDYLILIFLTVDLVVARTFQIQLSTSYYAHGAEIETTVIYGYSLQTEYFSFSLWSVVVSDLMRDDSNDSGTDTSIATIDSVVVCTAGCSKDSVNVKKEQNKLSK